MSRANRRRRYRNRRALARRFPRTTWFDARGIVAESFERPSLWKPRGEHQQRFLDVEPRRMFVSLNGGRGLPVYDVTATVRRITGVLERVRDMDAGRVRAKPVGRGPTT